MLCRGTCRCEGIDKGRAELIYPRVLGSMAASADRTSSDLRVKLKKIELTWSWAIWIDSLALLNHSLQLSLRSTSNSPSDIYWEASRDMLSSEGPSVSRSSPDDDVVFTIAV